MATYLYKDGRLSTEVITQNEAAANADVVLRHVGSVPYFTKDGSRRLGVRLDTEFRGDLVELIVSHRLVAYAKDDTYSYYLYPERVPQPVVNDFSDLVGEGGSPTGRLGKSEPELQEFPRHTRGRVVLDKPNIEHIDRAAPGADRTIIQIQDSIQIDVDEIERRVLLQLLENEVVEGDTGIDEYLRENGIRIDEGKLDRLIEFAKKVQITPEMIEAQRRSFATGNLAIDSDRPIEEIRKEVDAAADELNQSGGLKGAASEILSQPITDEELAAAAPAVKPDVLDTTIVQGDVPVPAPKAEPKKRKKSSA